VDTSILIPIFAVMAVIALGFAWRRDPQVKARTNGGGNANADAKTAANAKSSKASAKRGDPQRDRKAAPRPLEGIPNFADEGDLDITVIKAVVIGDLLADATKKPSDADLEVDAEEAENANKTSRVELSYEDEADAEEVTHPVARILICAAGDSDRGQRRPKNEDSLLVLPERSLFAVADGMGGYRGGEIASTLAIDTMRHAFETGQFEGKVECEQPMPRRGRELACAIQMGNQAIRGMAQLDPELAQMGTTLVSARFSPNKQRVYIGHVGDSRCYRLRGNTLRQLTTDHTLSTLGVKGAHANELFQAMGVKPDITIDLIVDKPRDNDLYMLCSDGLSKMVSDDEVREILVAEPDLEAAVYGLIECANDRGGRDNITIILVKVVSRIPPDISKPN
jgi:serine/threonine protein phosphatase PrpC